jgi:hypothetical protein
MKSIKSRDLFFTQNYPHIKMNNSFENKVNVKGILKIMDSQKINKAGFLEHKFMDEERLK